MRSTTSIADDRSAGGDPTYVQGRSRSELHAHFRSGATIQVELGRRRRYPGLAGPAPPTQGCYRKFLELGIHARHLLDVGCGAGMGLRCLLQQSSARITGIDCDGRAIAFAREYAPDAEFLHGDVQSAHLHLTGVAAIVVDVLGLVSDPVKVLRGVSHRLPDVEALFVAEPVANLGQTLVPPARRAFSVSTLRSLFVRSGFNLDDWTTVDDTFLCAIGRPLRDPLSDALIQAEEAYLAHQSQKFEVLCGQLKRSDRADLRFEAAMLESRFRFDLNQFDRAIALLTDACALAPQDPRPWAGLARLALVSGSGEHAKRLAAAATKIDASDFSAVCSSALAHLEADPRRSFEAWKSASALAPDESTIAQMLCAAALAQGRHEEGLSVLDRLGQYPKCSSQLNEHVGLIALTTAALQSSRSA